MKALNKIKELFTDSVTEESFINELIELKGLPYKFSELTKERIVLLGNTMDAYTITQNGVKKVIVAF